MKKFWVGADEFGCELRNVRREMVERADCLSRRIWRNSENAANSILGEKRTRNEQVEQAYGQAMKLFGSLQSKLLALEEHLGVEVKWVEPESKPGHYEVKKVRK